MASSSSWYLLPEDLVIDQILSRLPVKSLMRFKSVCKRWHSLPTNPSFIASHLKHRNTPNTLASWNGDNGLIVGHEGFHLFTVRCEEELIEAIAMATGEKKDCLCFIEVIVHKDDTSKELLEWGSRVSSADSRPPNPQ